jgi:hemoglobin-like flavoprotein
MLTKEDIETVQRDWEKVEAIKEQAATLLYDRLFTLDPAARKLFGADLAEQKMKLIRMIGATVYGLSNPNLLLPIVTHLGRKHAQLGVKNKDYATVEAALFWALRNGLGPAFGPSNEAAWRRVYGVLADAMKATP